MCEVIMKDIYIVFSATPYKIGKFIRFFTKAKFNHVSVSFDRNLFNAYTFARRYIDAPFFGRFIKDSPARYFYKNQPADVTVCKTEVDDGVFENMKAVCEKMYGENEEYLYNFFSATSYVFGRRVFIDKAFTCVEFAAYILSFADAEINKSGFYTVDGLFEVFKDRTVYSGPADFIADNGSFGERRGFFKGIADTFGLFFKLIKRI